MSDLILKYGFQTIHSNVTFNNTKALNLVNSNHVINVEEIKPSDCQLSFISGHVIRQTSVTSMPYKVKIEVLILSFILYKIGTYIMYTHHV